MDFDRDDVGAVDQQRRADAGGIEGRLVRPADGRGRQRRRSDRSRRHVVAIDLGAVEIDDGAVVADEAQIQSRHHGLIGDRETLAEIGSNELVVRIGPKGDDGGFVAVAVAQFGGAALPGGIIKSSGAPGGALVGAVVEIFPNRAGGDVSGRRGRAG